MSEFNINEDAQSGGELPGSSNEHELQPEESAFPDEDEETITMLDVIERENELEEEASAVLGNSDEKNCTYPKGYVPRQALYSCATCCVDPSTPAAICLACSLECHDNHEVYELYTKRNYRCDCGNSRFKDGFNCKLMTNQEKKAPNNDLNNYNHNFFGRYCICDKKYPPEEGDDSIEAKDEMWQCIVCEDWYHSKHLTSGIESPHKFEEMICGPCVDKLDFIRYYKKFDNPETTTGSDEFKSCVHPDGAAKIDNAPETFTNDVGTEVPAAKSDSVNEGDTNDSQLENKDPDRQVVVVGPSSTKDQQNAGCILDKLRIQANGGGGANNVEQSNEILDKKESSTNRGPIFWTNCSWRAKLCRCNKCLELYKTLNCEYLLDACDTVQYYEAQGKEMAKHKATPIERGMSALNNMNRAAVAEAINGYRELKADLSTYLRKFADSKKVVREEDIHEFFEQLKSKKRPKFDSA